MKATDPQALPALIAAIQAGHSKARWQVFRQYRYRLVYFSRLVTGTGSRDLNAELQTAATLTHFVFNYFWICAGSRPWRSAEEIEAFLYQATLSACTTLLEWIPEKTKQQKNMLRLLQNEQHINGLLEKAKVFRRLPDAVSNELPNPRGSFRLSPQERIPLQAIAGQLKGIATDWQENLSGLDNHYMPEGSQF
ncbi:MAG TPA: hypothetical protein VG738_22545 [Chitinophagaceae bacterium]|nr:hypothetical protein [Chitinophagaceae bacterium]